MTRFFILSLFVFTQIAHSAQSTTVPIELQPHQKLPVQYLAEHPEQKGLLLFHSLGSGKTYIALEFTEKSPNQKVVILLPEFLKSNWLTQMKSFGVKDLSRYELVSLQESEKLLTRDLSKTIVIVDEVHKLVQKIRQTTGKVSEKYIDVYAKVKTANRLLLLTGTPIFVDTSDIAYIANLLVEDEPYPVDPLKFRTEFMSVKPVTSLVRGHVTESKLMMVGVPFLVTLGAVVTLGTALPWAVPLVALAGSAVIPITNEVFPANQVVFREFDTDKWKNFSEKYISYYHVKLAENENYPTKVVLEKKVLYNDSQSNFFLNFVDEDLSTDQLKTMLAEEEVSYSSSYMKFHSSKLQSQLLASTVSGLEIGNLDFKTPNQGLIESPKFLEILKTIQQSPGQVAVYSNYFVNGIQRFAAFLDRSGLKDQYFLLSPEQSVDQQMKIVDQYNKAEKRILLIHPEITEGISLVGTEQFHILEPIQNAPLLEQIIGRAIRFRSHLHLPPERRVVHAYLWESAIEYSKSAMPTSAGLLRRSHWQRKYSEVNPSMWSKGIIEIDSNYFLKNETPDERVKRTKSAIEKDLKSFQQLLEDHSIESSMKK
jgi:hypothetical protein